MNNIHVPNNELQVSDSNKIYDKYSDEINKKINTFKAKPDIDDDRKDDIEESGELVRLCNVRKLQIDTSISCVFLLILDALRRVISGDVSVEKLCLKCLELTKKGKMEEHPFFIGSLCKDCSV